MSFYKNATVALKAKGGRMTEPRRIVLSAFDQAKKPITPYQLKDMFNKGGHKIDVVTIYRIISYLEKLGLVHKLHSAGGYVKCSRADAQAIHSFFACSRCGNIEEFSGGDFTTFKDTVESGHDFKIADCVLELRGLCKHCKKWI